MSIIKLFTAVIIISAVSASTYADISVIPRPQSLREGSGSFAVTAKTIVSAPAGFAGDAFFLTGAVNKALGTDLSVTTKTPGKNESGIIQFVKIGSNDLGKEGYNLSVTPDMIKIEASDSAGAFYAVQTLLQLMPVEVWSGKKADKSGIPVPAVEITDKPSFSWRGFMLDESRHFQGKQAVKELLDEMALLKMNIFHWHLVDDQGWRIEIKKYPKLTAIGSKRKDTQIGGWKSKKLAGKPHSGFYTQDEIREIVKYAAARHITVVPEIEMPGHSEAAMAAYPEMDCDKTPREVPIRFGKHYSCYNPADEKVYKFLEDILTEVMDLFPSKVIHIGGDEVKYDHWQNSKEVNNFMKKKGLKTYADLQIYFTNRISKFIESKGRRMMGWNEILGAHLHEYQKDNGRVTGELAPNTIIHFWKGSPDLAKEAAERGYDLVNSYHKYTYLDYGYKQISLKKAYGFDPVIQGISPKAVKKTLGVECPMWGEWTPDIRRVHFQTFPRLAAYAEVGWTDGKNKNYGDFLRRMKNMTQHWKFKSINYNAKAVK